MPDIRKIARIASMISPSNSTFCPSERASLSGRKIKRDVVRFIASPVSMVGTGWVGSAATHLYLGAQRERRFCSPKTRFLIHQPSGGAGGPASDIALQAEQIIKARERIAQVIAQASGQPIERVRQDIERDLWMPAEEAVAYGLVSRIVQHRRELG